MRGGFIRKFLFFALLLIVPLTLWAGSQDDLPCGDQNNPFDTPCPLDTWVVILVIISAIGASYHLYSKGKSTREQGNRIHWAKSIEKRTCN